MKLCVVMAMWQRPEITSIALDNLALRRESLAGTFELVPVVVGSEGAWSRQLAESHGALYVECENKPLGRKWTRGLWRARAEDPDACLILGSDNLVNDTLLLQWTGALREGAEYVGALDAYQYNPKHQTLIHWEGYVGQREGEPIGSSRCFAKSLLDKLKWRIWEESYNRGLDYSTTERLAKIEHTRRVFRMADTQARHLGIKINKALSPSLHNHPGVQSLDQAVLIDWYGDIGARVLALGQKPG